MTRDSTKGRWYVFLVIVRRYHPIATAVAVAAQFGVAVLGYGQLRGRFMDIDEALVAFETRNYALR